MSSPPALASDNSTHCEDPSSSCPSKSLLNGERSSTKRPHVVEESSGDEGTVSWEATDNEPLDLKRHKGALTEKGKGKGKDKRGKERYESESDDQVGGGKYNNQKRSIIQEENNCDEENEEEEKEKLTRKRHIKIKQEKEKENIAEGKKKK